MVTDTLCFNPFSRHADKNVLQRHISNNDVRAEIATSFDRCFPCLEELPGNIVSAETLNCEFPDAILQRCWSVKCDDLSRAHDSNPVAERISFLDIVRCQQYCYT